jgi:hypothetical protein
MNCKYCQQEKKLIKAHVIPESFFRRLCVGESPPRLLTEKEGIYPKRASKGVYDPNILCIDCERLFGDWDNYGQKFLTVDPIGEPKVVGSKIVGYEVPHLNYPDLKLFFVSLVWRASVSEHPFYERIRLGPYEEVAKRLIEHRDPGDAEIFSVILARFDHPLGTAILDPHPEKINQVIFCRFYLAGYIAYIKVDKRPTPEPFNKLILRDGMPASIICRTLENSKELPLIQQIAKVANQRLHVSAKNRVT